MVVYQCVLFARFLSGIHSVKVDYKKKLTNNNVVSYYIIIWSNYLRIFFLCELLFFVVVASVQIFFCRKPRRIEKRFFQRGKNAFKRRLTAVSSRFYAFLLWRLSSRFVREKTRQTLQNIAFKRKQINTSDSVLNASKRVFLNLAKKLNTSLIINFSLMS